MHTGTHERVHTETHRQTDRHIHTHTYFQTKVNQACMQLAGAWFKMVKLLCVIFEKSGNKKIY